MFSCSVHTVFCVSQATRTCIALRLSMVVLHPLMEGGSSGVVSDSRQGRPVLKLGVPLSTSSFNTACYNLTKSVGIRKIFFGTNTTVGLGWAQPNGIWYRCGCHAWVDFRIPACNTQLLHIGQYYGDLPQYLTHVIIQDLCKVCFSTPHLLILANLKCSHTGCYDGQYKQVSYEYT